MKQLAYVMSGHSEYDNELWKILNVLAQEKWDNYSFDGFDYIKLVPIFVLSGAAIKPIADSKVEGFTVEVNEKDIDDFYTKVKSKLYLYRGSI